MHSRRAVARGLFDCWVVDAYLHYGEFHALTALWDDFHYEVKTRAAEGDRHDDAPVRARAEAEHPTGRSGTTTQAKQRWNKANPDQPPKERVEQAPMPPGVPIDSECSTAPGDVAKRGGRGRLGGDAVDSGGTDVPFGVHECRPFAEDRAVAAHPTSLQRPARDRGYIIDVPDCVRATCAE